MYQKNINWDISLHVSDFPEKIKKVFFKISLKNRKYFSNWVGVISKKYFKEIDWWSMPFTSRDTANSHLYKYILILETLKILSKKYKKINITSHSINEINILKEICLKNKIELNIRLKKNFYTNKTFFLKIKSLIFQCLIIIYIKFFIQKKKIDQSNKIKNLTLIDFFATNSILSSIFPYKNLDTFLKKNKKYNVFFVPTFIIDKNISNIFKIINYLDKKNCVFKEHYLSLYDILYSNFHFLRKERYRTRFTYYKGWDVSKFIHEEINNLDSFLVQTAITNYLFSKNLYHKNIKIEKVIDWFENQSVDKGWNMGFRKYYPNVQHVGYQAFPYYPSHMHNLTASHEEKFKVIPKKIISIGKAYTKLKKEFFPKVKISTGPALNYTGVFKNIKKKIKIKNLLILSGIKAIDEKLIKWILFLIKKDNQIKVTIKPHPILPLNNLSEFKNIKNLNQISITNKNLSEILNFTKNTICTGPTSGVIESVIKKCYLIFPVFDCHDKSYLKQLKVSKKFYKLVYSKEEFSLEMIKINKNKINFTSKKTQNEKIKNYLFEKITDKNMELFYK